MGKDIPPPLDVLKNLASATVSLRFCSLFCAFAFMRAFLLLAVTFLCLLLGVPEETSLPAVSVYG